MPIFEYRCKQCGNEFELLVKSTKGGGKIRCEKCGSGKLEKLLSAPAVHMRDNAVTRCGKESTCCGASTPCEAPTCER